jgi:hypothetical protein
LADKIILASPLYRGRSVSTVELTTDGLTGLRQKGFEVVEVKEQVKAPRSDGIDFRARA